MDGFFTYDDRLIRWFLNPHTSPWRLNGKPIRGISSEKSTNDHWTYPPRRLAADAKCG